MVAGQRGDARVLLVDADAGGGPAARHDLQRQPGEREDLQAAGRLAAGLGDVEALVGDADAAREGEAARRRRVPQTRWRAPKTNPRTSRGRLEVVTYHDHDEAGRVVSRRFFNLPPVCQNL